ncbi:hypothetical protein SDC9_32154 [bioreactor metagenome]|uniref:Uncharacterized protein n=2 Tax=root TaxID=1 RepID=A0A644V4P7_9ZZZZ
MIIKRIKFLIKEKYINLLIFLILFKHIISMKNILKIYNKFSFNKNNKGQLSIEFLLISFIFILMLVSISLPLTEIAIDSSISSVNLIETKSEILKIVNSIDDVYSDGVGSKRTLFVEMPRETNLKISKNQILNKGIAIGTLSSLNDSKTINITFDAINVDSIMNFKKSTNYKIIIEWPLNNENIIVKM